MAGGLMAARDWARPFDDGVLRTPGDAGRYVTVLPEEMQRQPGWQTAAQLLMMAAEGKAPLIFAHSVNPTRNRSGITTIIQ
jgi:hypothetical protein